MARIRSIKPEFWTSEQVMSLSRDARLLFIGMWTFCDDNGIHPASALSIKAEVLPGDEINADQVTALIDEMIEQGLVEEYEITGRTFWRVTGWRAHQRIDHPTFRHPTGDARGDAGDTNKKRVTCVTKRLGGKQRQIVLKKLRHRDGDACHLCGDSSSLGIFSGAESGEENPNDINLLRLICSACKRKNKHGDTKKTGGDTGDAHGDAKSFVGDSTTEWSGVEWSGGVLEGDDNSKTKSSSQPPTTDPETRIEREHPGQPVKLDRHVQIALLLRAQGVNVTAANPLVAVTWAQNPKVTDDVLNIAVAKAKATLEKQGRTDAPGESYLKPIIEQLLAQQDAPAPAAARPPAPPRTPTGNDPKGLDESYDAYHARIDKAEQDRRKGQP